MNAGPLATLKLSEASRIRCSRRSPSQSVGTNWAPVNVPAPSLWLHRDVRMEHIIHRLGRCSPTRWSNRPFEEC